MTETPTKWGRRGLWRLAAAAAVSASALVGLPKLAAAAKRPAKVKFKGKKNQLDAEKEVKNATDLGFLLLLRYGDEIDGVAVGDPNNPPQEWNVGDPNIPPLGETGDIYEANIKVQLFQKNPKCIRCTHGGKVIQVCQ